MRTKWRGCFWLSSLAMVFTLVEVAMSDLNHSVWAQIVPDETLGIESSVVTPDTIKGIESDRISGGAVRGNNLFHSFREFNIGEERGGYFENPAAIENIFSRVTGSNPSEILGTLGVLGNANLFFLNPNGIIFGNNASLDLRGSFLSTTADSIVFPDGKQFSATNPEVPPLLTVNVQQPIGLEFQGRERTISHQGNLAVDLGQNLALVGGNLIIDGGRIVATGGKVELGGLSAAGEIGINADGSLSFPDGIEKADVTLTNAAEVDVRGASGGNITVNARNINISGGKFGASALRAGIAPDSGSNTAQAGDITLNATSTINVSQGSRILNRVEESGVGNAGGINITTANLSLTQGGFISATSFGEGNGGAITINASGNISATGEDQAGFASGIFTGVAPTGVGNPGGIKIATANLSLTQGGQVSTNSAGGEGNAEAIIINASGTISADGSTQAGFASGIFSQVVDGEGNGGGINITTTNLSLTQGGVIDASTFAQGNAGAITIDAANTIFISAVRATQVGFRSGIFSQVTSTGTGNSGGINITTTDLSLTQGGRVDATTFGEGDSGVITINASGTISADGEDRAGFNSGIFSGATGNAINTAGGIKIKTSNLFLTRGGRVEASTFGEGNAELITINASDTISADGATQAGVSSGIFSGVGEFGEGNSDGINLTTTNLFLTRGGRVDASTFGKGNAGAITINTSDTISADGASQAGVSSGIFSGVGEFGVGNSDGINLTTTDFSLTDGAVVSTRTEGEGKAGNLTITANLLEITGGGQIQTNTTSDFKAANILLEINDKIFISGTNSGLFAQTDGAGDAGNININTSQLTIDQGASISAFTENSGNGGTITINVPNGLLITDNSQLTVETSNAGKPGEITITTPKLTIGKDAEISATATATSTNTEAGGSITINTSNLDLTGKLGIFAETRGESPAGTLEIQPYTEQTELKIKFTDTAILSTLTTASGVGGDINLYAPETININGQGKITVETSGSGNAGNISIETKNLNITDHTQISASTSGMGKAGDINITAAKFNLLEGANLFTNTSGRASAGDIKLNITDSINLSDSNIRAGTTKDSTGNGGNIFIDPATMTIQHGAEIATDSQGSGQGGNITLEAGLLTLDNGKITAETASNQGGEITLTLTDKLILRNNSPITATAGNAEAGGDGGNIKINAPFIIAFPYENSDITANAFRGNGGNITIDTQGIFGIEFRNQQTALSDITASSRFGQQGEVEINTSAIDPTRNLNNLQQDTVEAKVTQSCQEMNSQTTLEFFDIGRGGLPPTPEDLFTNDAIIAEWISLDFEEHQTSDEIFSETEFTKTKILKFSCHN